MPGDYELQIGQRVEVVTRGLANDKLGPRRDPERRPGDLPDRVEVLLTEVQAEPGVHELDVGRRHEDVVIPAAFIDPPLRGRSVQLADQGGIRRGMPRRLHPDVVAPRPALLLTEQVADHRAVAERNDPRSPIRRERLLDGRPRHLRSLERGIHQRLCEPVPAMPLGEQRGGAVDVAGLERTDLDPRGMG